ncbi:TPA: hypothetical protein DCX15_03190 [bacterium]|nr:hypothetical protein [bacterium]
MRKIIKILSFIISFIILTLQPKILSFIILTPLIINLLRFCPYHLPFFYCTLCYVRCIQGRFRWWIILGILLLNIRGKLFCRLLCPCGTVQDSLSCLKTRKFGIPPRIKILRVVFTLGVILGVLFIDKLLALLVYAKPLLCFVGLIILSSLFIPRLWCQLFCPLGALSDGLRSILHVLKLQNKSSLR